MTSADRASGARVKLTSLRDADIDTIISWDDDREYMRLLNSGPAYPRPEAAQRAWWNERLGSTHDYHFAIRVVENDQLIGTFHITSIEWPNRAASFSIGIGAADARGQGFGSEALEIGIAFAFDDLDLHRLQLDVFSYNKAAIRLYERHGFTHEGTYREYLQRDGKRYDMLLFGLLAHEWRARQAE